MELRTDEIKIENRNFKDFGLNTQKSNIINFSQKKSLPFRKNTDSDNFLFLPELLDKQRNISIYSGGYITVIYYFINPVNINIVEDTKINISCVPDAF